MRKNIEKHFGVRVCIEMPTITLKNFRAQLSRIGEITVVCKGYPVGRIYIKWLRKRRARTTLCRITNMTNTKRA